MGENGMTDEPKPKSDGRFQKGHPGYRRKGTPNKFTKDVKQWLLEAAMNIGLDGQGKNAAPASAKVLDAGIPKPCWPR
jgi:hypothetical protein